MKEKIDYLSYAVQKLSMMECPDFKKDYPNEHNDVYSFWSTFYSMDRSSEAKKSTIDSLNKLIEMESKGKVKIELPNKKEQSQFRYGIMGPATYLVLKSKTKRQKFTFGPYAEPFAFDPGR